MTILLAKSAKAVADASEHGPFDIVTCPEPVSGEFEVMATTLFTQPHLDSTGTVIPSVDRARHNHVAQIVNNAAELALQTASEDELIYFLAADVIPVSGWREKLAVCITGDVGMACAIVPDPANPIYVKAHPAFGLQYDVNVGSITAPLTIYAGTVDCCVFTKEALQLCLPINASRICLEVGIADKMMEVSKRITLAPRTTCWLRNHE